MAITPPVKYDLDYTGLNPNNLVVSEPHVLDLGGTRIIVPNYGPFFTDPNTLILIDQATGKRLAPRTQYVAIQLEEEPTLESGKEICSLLVIEDAKVSDNVLVTYQALGGPLSYSVQAIIEMVKNLDLDDRAVTWGAIVGKPNRFPPTAHTHPLTDVYGWQRLAPMLEAIRVAILTGDQAQFDQIRSDFEKELDKLRTTMGGQLNQLQADFEASMKAIRAELNYVIVTADTQLEIKRRYLVMGGHTLRLPASASLNHGDWVLISKLLTAEPIIMSPDAVIMTVNGSDSIHEGVLFNLNDEVKAVWNKTMSRWEI